MAIVRLPKTGTIILTSDNVIFPENLSKNLLPDTSLVYNPTGILSAYEYIRFLQGRDDRFFPLEFQRRVVADRLGIPVEELPGGHLIALSQPKVLADALSP